MAAAARFRRATKDGRSAQARPLRNEPIAPAPLVGWAGPWVLVPGGCRDLRAPFWALDSSLRPSSKGVGGGPVWSGPAPGEEGSSLAAGEQQEQRHQLQGISQAAEAARRAPGGQPVRR